jgi:hypothetical protein
MPGLAHTLPPHEGGRISDIGPVHDLSPAMSALDSRSQNVRQEIFQEKISPNIFKGFHNNQEENGARYKDRTCDPYHVKVVLYR